MSAAGIIIAALGGGLLLMGAAGSGQAQQCPVPVNASDIREMARRVEAVTGPWPGLADYLVAVAFWESSGRDGGPSNACACEKWHTGGKCKPNAARGLYQIRPVTADVPGVVDNPAWLYDPAFATAAATWLIWRLQKNRSPGRAVNWLAIRRGWKLPSLVTDEWEENPKSAKTRENFKRSLQSVGIPVSFMFQRAMPAGLVWPGFNAVLAAIKGKV